MTIVQSIIGTGIITSLFCLGDQLEVVSVMAVGVDAIDTVELKKREIRLGHTPDVLTDAVVWYVYCFFFHWIHGGNLGTMPGKSEENFKNRGKSEKS